MSLSGWDDTKKLKLTIDSSKVDEDLTDFPVLITLSSGCGIGGFDASCVFEELNAIQLDEVNDSFTGVNGEFPNSNLWRSNYPDYIQIYDNKLRFDDLDSYTSIYSSFYFYGDFSTQVDFYLNTYPSTNWWSLDIRFFFGNNDCVFLNREYRDSVHRYKVASYIDGSWSTLALYSSTDSFGKLQIIRSGNKFSFYKWDNTNECWYCILSNHTQEESKMCYVMSSRTVGVANPVFGFDLDNFSVNYGNIFFPKRLTISTTISGVETQCYTEIESWNPEINEAVLWTKIPTIVSGTDTEIYLYYDKAHANDEYIGFTGETSAQNVWDSNFIGVWHMADDPSLSTNCITDSTSSNSHGTSGGSMTSDDLVDGKIGKAIDFDNTDDYVEISDLFYSNLFTLEATINPLANGISDSIIVKRNSSGGTNGLGEWGFLTHDTKLYFQAWDSVGVVFNTVSSYGSIVSGTNTYVAGVATGKDNDCFLMVNSAKDGTYTQSNDIRDTSSVVQFGARSNNNDDRWFNGIIDEVRISIVSRSEAWLKSTYYSNWDNLITYEQYERCFSGIVNVEGVPAIRRVNLYHQDTGELINYTTSASGTGEWSIDVYGDTVNKYYAVCVPESSDRNAEIFAHVTGV